jgi:DNA polymerase-3 subunit delta'
MQEGLCHDLWQKPRPGGRRIAIVDDVDFLNEESANCLLKTLEEPPPGAVVMLVGTSLERQLPTIRSRSQIIRFHRLDEATVTRLLLANGLVADPAEAARIASHSDGSLERAAELLDEGYWDFRRHWLETLSAASLDSVAASAALLAFADAAGKEASARRGRIRQVIDLSIDFFTSLARAWVGAPVSEQADIAEAVTRRTATWTGDEETAATCAERSLEAREQLDRYVHQATLVECWMNDLAHTQSLTASA